ncbi:MAG: SRPBCC family protein [Thaumarchaeota archaeon]|nr:SRPBCC family protein [Nitrososphaerota archaeon]
MGRIFTRTEIRAGVDDVFDFLANPHNISLVWPKEFSIKILQAPERLENGSVFSFQTTLLGQKFMWKSRITSFIPVNEFTDEAVESPFKKWSHQHRLKKSNGTTVMEDEIEFKTPLGPLGDVIARGIVSRIMDYRNASFRRVFGESITPVYKDPLRIGLPSGTVLSILAIIIGIILALNLPFENGLFALVTGLISWVLMWFFTHDLAHLIVGLLAGVRFSHYYLGLSNIVRLRIIPNSLKLVIVALGLKIERGESRAGRTGFAAMYVAGPIASMIAPFFIPAVILARDASSVAGLILLALSIINLGFTLWFSPKVGCIHKARKLFRK